MARNTDPRTLVTVGIPGFTALRYGFPSGLKDSLRTEFGQTAVNFDQLGTGLVLGANSPKPYRAGKRLTTGFESSFCDSTKVKTLKAAGWSITFPKIRAATKSALSTTLFVTIGGIKYAWTTPTLPAGFTVEAIGAKVAGSDDKDLVFGARFPRPARYSTDLTVEGSENVTTLSIFVDPTKEDTLQGAGWRRLKSAVVAFA